MKNLKRERRTRKATTKYVVLIEWRSATQRRQFTHDVFTDLCSRMRLIELSSGARRRAVTLVVCVPGSQLLGSQHGLAAVAVREVPRRGSSLCDRRLLLPRLWRSRQRVFVH